MSIRAKSSSRRTPNPGNSKPGWSSLSSFPRPHARFCGLLLASAIMASMALGVGACRPRTTEEPAREETAGPEQAPSRPRVIVLGFDGVDPGLLQRWVDEGLLPNIERLIQRGHFSPLRTTTPPQSPVAWATFASGHNPGEHGIYDFIRRNPRNYLPQVATVRVDRPQVRGGRIVRPLRGENLRRGVSFWQTAGQSGVRGSVLFIPYSYPPDGAGEMRVVSGLGTPDVRGTNATFHYFAQGEFPEDKEPGMVSGGTFVKAEPDGEALYRAMVTGPNVERDGRRDPSVIAATFKVEDDCVVHSHQDQEGRTKRGEWSDPLTFDFEITGEVNYRAMSRFYPVENRKDPLAVYLGSLSADPRNPPFELSFPGSFAGELAQAIGRPFKTVGWVHEMNGLSAEALDEAGFLLDMYDTMEVRAEILLHVLESRRDELTVAAFTATDRVAHMFWRLFDEEHPRHDAELAALYGNAIRDTYVRMDEIVGRVLDVIEEDALLFIMSDHGFHGFARGLNLNRWLVNEGYMVLRDGATEGGDFFRDVDWSRTRAYAMGTGQLWLNVQGRERDGIVPAADAENLAKEIAAKLDGLMDVERSKVAVTAVSHRADIYSGESFEDAPDLTVSFAPNYRTAWPSILGAAPTTLFEDNDRKWSGEHAANRAEDTPGILISNRKLEVDDPGLEDFGPTVLSLYGVSANLPGKVWRVLP